MKHILRIELIDADDSANAALATALHREGFEHSVAGRDGQRYRLPSGEFSYDGKATVHDVLEAAQRAANTTGKKYRAVATEVAGQVWAGLDPA